MHGNICTVPHSQAYIGSNQSRRIIDTVSHHGNDMLGAHEAADDCCLFGRQYL